MNLSIDIQTELHSFLFEFQSFCQKIMAILTYQFDINNMILYLLSDIIIFHVLPNVGIKSIIMLPLVSKQFHTNKKNLYSYLISNDKFLYDYTRFYNINLIYTITISSISYKLFDDIYNFIKCKQNKLILSNYGRNIIKKEQISQQQINNSFKIFRLLKTSVKYKCSENNHQTKCASLISKLMETYFTELFFARNGSYPSGNFMYNIDTMWEKINLNLYNLLENLNILCQNTTSESFKANLNNFDNIIINLNGFDTKNTILFLCEIFFKKFPLNYNVYLYINYIIYRYMNSVFQKQISSEIIKDLSFIQALLKKLISFKERVNSYTLHQIQPYFKDIILNELNEFMIKIKK